MSNQDSNGGGGLVRDGATQTGRAVILIALAIVVAVVLLHHSKPAAVNASTTKSAGGTSATTLPSTATTVPASGGSGTTTPASTPATTTGPTVPVANVKVLVLNGASFSQSIASEFTAKLKTMGYNTLTPNNATSTVQQTAIYVVTHGFAPEAQALAASLGMPATVVKTELPSGPPLPSGIPGTGANLVLLVGPDLAANGASTNSGTTPPASGSGSPTPGTTAAPSPGTTAPPSGGTTAPRGRT